MGTIYILLIFTMMVLKKIRSVTELKGCFFDAIMAVKNRFFHLMFWDKIILLGVLLGMISLFLDWVIFEGLHHNAFHALVGANGYLLFIAGLGLALLLASVQHKHKIRMHTGWHIGDVYVAFGVGVLFMILPVHALVFLDGLSSLTEVSHGSGIGLSITAGIVILFAAIRKKAHMKAHDMSVHLVSQQDDSGLHSEPSDSEKLDNMKLPF